MCSDELRLKIEHIEELMSERQKAATDALLLQAREYERRLESLNDEAGRLRQMQQTYVPRELYESNLRDLRRSIWNAAVLAVTVVVGLLGIVFKVD